MLRNYQVATQLVVSRVTFSPKELVSQFSSLMDVGAEMFLKLQAWNINLRFRLRTSASDPGQLDGCSGCVRSANALLYCLS
jgi:hypothetical protein